jgi:hypothetical protein
METDMPLLLLAVEVSEDLADVADAAGVVEIMLTTPPDIDADADDIKLVNFSWWASDVKPDRIVKALEGSDNWGKLVHAVEYLEGLAMLRRIVTPAEPR